MSRSRFVVCGLKSIAFTLFTMSAAFADTGRYCSQPGSVSSHCHAFDPPASTRQSSTSSAAVTDSTLSSAERLKQELVEVGIENFTSPNYKPGLIRHVVLFRYLSSVTAEQKEEVKSRFLALQQLSKRNGSHYIVSIETGAENSGEGVDQGLEQGFIVTFKSQGDRNYYVGQPIVTDSRYYEPAHQTFKEFVGPLLDQNGALVFDFAVGMP